MASAMVHPHPTSPRRLQRQGCVSFSLQGEGLGVAGDLNFLADDFQHAVGIAEDVVVPETDNAVAVGFDQFCAFDVGGVVRVLPAIEFDDKAQAAAGEVGDVWADGILEDKFGVFDLSVADALPQPFFDLGAVAAQGAGDACHPAACHNQLPLPSGEFRVGHAPGMTFDCRGQSTPKLVGVRRGGRQVRKQPSHPLIQLRLGRVAAKASYPSPPGEKTRDHHA